MTTTLLTPAPTFGADEAQDLAHRYFGLDGTAEPLASERDQNFLIKLADQRRFVLKIANAAEDAAYLEMQVQLLRHAQTVDPGLPIPRLHSALDGQDLVHTTSAKGVRHGVRVVGWLPGTALAKSGKSAETLTSVGSVLGRLDRALMSFGHAASHRVFDWDLKQTPRTRGRLDFIVDRSCRTIVERVLDRFDSAVAPRLKHLRASVIHNDANDWNVFVESADGGPVTGLIDIGDALHTTTVNELAIALAYVMLDTASPLEAAATVIAGYHAALPLTEDEFAVLFDLVRARLAISVSMSAMRADRTADNPYLSISERPAWDMLARLDRIEPDIAQGVFRSACGLDAAAGASRARQWITANVRSLAPVAEPAPARMRKHVLDLADPGSALVGAVSSGDHDLREAVWANEKRSNGFALGIGSWGERRKIYTTDAFVSKLADGDRRDVHLGLDLFLDAGTAVQTPLGATVVDVWVCPNPQDYGGCVLLQHDPEPGVTFRSLWGHLAPASIATLRPGQFLAKGASFAQLGDFSENGGWIAHLHLQLVTTKEQNADCIIGVGEDRFRRVWQDLYPDAASFAGVPPETFLRTGRPVPELLAERKQRLGANLSVAYGKAPLKIVRGDDVWLYDDTGRAYLDCYNNVAHVGHAHPRVVHAIADQAARLNTNTRYLHDLILDYCARLTATLPPSLSVCFFTTSGSEANDLAIRMARVHSRQHDIIVVDWAYHGHTELLIDLSPYKYRRSGGAGRRDYVHEVSLPEAYRAPAAWPESEVGARFAGEVAAVAEQLLQTGRPPAAFITESVWSCGGQVFAPEGYFRDAYAAARHAGAVVIADEVQVGFGRLGSGLWGFERHGVVPDILTLGKPIGNGHPMAAVITTPEIAASFANGMEYFATFGGNPVSCAAGLAVLDVLDQEQLVPNAREQGDYLLEGFRRLQQRFPAIGEVRGEGLFLGLDLVKDPASKAHDRDTAARLSLRMRELGVLIGTDGPRDNVLKMRPPMTFNRDHADQLLDILHQALVDCCQ